MSAALAVLHPSGTPVDWLAEAGALEDRILDAARRTPNGDVVWLHPRSGRDGSAQPVLLGPSLYNGTTGVALFLAALESIAPRDGRRECLLAALAPVRRQLRTLITGQQAGAPPLGLGGFLGLGGYLYSFPLIGEWLREPALIAEAAEIAALVTPDRIAADAALDVMSGCAGAALALLALDRWHSGPLRGGATPVELAAACGEHLLARRTAIAGEPRAWAGSGRPARCGFAHGAAGISYCLTRLFERTGEAGFRDAAEEGAAFERFHYDPEHGNWPLLGLPERRFMLGWCGGAPGVALGRLGMLGLGSEPVRQDLQAALDTTVASSKPTFDSLCCGSLGRAEVLLQAHRRLGEERLLEAAETAAAEAVLHSREHGGSYRWTGAAGAAGAPVSPAFFTGAAGVGFTLLRFARPSLLPCVLALEGTK